MNSHTFNRTALDAFKATWPCHGLPEKLHSIRFEFGSNGDLVDIEAKARNGRALDAHDFDGSALVALSQDAQQLAAEPVTPVLFRVHRRSGEVAAVFPAAPSDLMRHTMVCYSRVGQHGSCSLDWYRDTRAATPAEYAALKSELEAAPYRYRLQVYQKITPAHRDAFDAEARRMRSLS